MEDRIYGEDREYLLTSTFHIHQTHMSTIYLNRYYRKSKISKCKAINDFIFYTLLCFTERKAINSVH